MTTQTKYHASINSPAPTRSAAAPSAPTTNAPEAPILVTWGDKDPFFSGHFAIETHGTEIAAELLELLGRAEQLGTPDVP